MHILEAFSIAYFRPVSTFLVTCFWPLTQLATVISRQVLRTSGTVAATRCLEALVFQALANAG